AAIDAGIARGALEAGLEFVRTKTRAWPLGTAETATQDPHLIGEVGRLEVDLHAAEEVLYRAGRTLDAIASQPVTAETSAQASVAVAEA
ncbi:SfnB family sulfur acquisition oxidoreductase, partial [Acinetobacter baumannii]